MRYDAGVEEFLSLTRSAELVITNSYHAMIFAAIFNRPCEVISREQCDTKIAELKPRLSDIAQEREQSLAFLKSELEML